LAEERAASGAVIEQRARHGRRQRLVDPVEQELPPLEPADADPSAWWHS
jgi:hypothetical protein